MFFGGDLRGRGEFESDYEASSSGRDEFDSDFDQTDSYPGKRGRKKGQKFKKRIVRESSGIPRGRPRKMKLDDDEAIAEVEKERNELKFLKKSKKIYQEVPTKSSYIFVIYKVVWEKKRNKKDSEKGETKVEEMELKEG